MNLARANALLYLAKDADHAPDQGARDFINDR
jgi:hypothetical protein